MDIVFIYYVSNEYILDIVFIYYVNNEYILDEFKKENKKAIFQKRNKEKKIIGRMQSYS